MYYLNIKDGLFALKPIDMLLYTNEDVIKELSKTEIITQMVSEIQSTLDKKKVDIENDTIYEIERSHIDEIQSFVDYLEAKRSSRKTLNIKDILAKVEACFTSY